jgi:transposase
VLLSQASPGASWAHLLRKFVSFSERDGPSAELGRQLLDYTGLLFDYWHDYKAGKLDRATFRAWMAPVRAQVEAVLARAAASGIDRLAGSCANILEHRAALWTFVDTDGVEPTNNHAERELRRLVGLVSLCISSSSTWDSQGAIVARNSTRTAALPAVA